MQSTGMKETLGVSVSKCFPVPMTARDHPPDPVGWDVSNNLLPYEETPWDSRKE